MFKKRYAEMDLYQEYRRSHERVKVMLDEKPEDIFEEPTTPPSAQDNLQKFISRHETNLKKIEDHIEEQQAINLAEETIPEENQVNSDPATSAMFRPMATGPELPPIEPEPVYNQNFYANPQNESSVQWSEDTYQPNYNFEYSNPNLPTQYANQEYPSAVDQVQNREKKEPIQHKKVEEELDDIIRDALSNVSASTNNSDDDVDPELLGMIKGLLRKTNVPLSDTSFPINYQDSFWNIPETPAQPSIHQTGPKSINESESVNSEDKAPASLDKQLTKEQIPPKVPQTKTTVKRPEIAGELGIFDPSFSTADIDDDSSLALTKKEISQQVKNLLRESLDDTKSETSKPNDLLQLEKQLKEHIEKIKQSKNST